jgi:hypothetical protein
MLSAYNHVLHMSSQPQALWSPRTLRLRVSELHAGEQLSAGRDLDVDAHIKHPVHALTIRDLGPDSG